MKSQRIRLQKSIFDSTSPTAGSSWRQQYFPFKPTQTVLQQNNKQPQTSNIPQQYRKLLQMYKHQNESIHKKNCELKQIARKLIQKQNNLLEEIGYLENYYRNITRQDNIRRQQYQKDIEQNKQNNGGNLKNQINKNNFCKNIKVVSSQIQTFYPDVSPTIKKQEDNPIKILNQQFCKLVEESINQKDSIKRKYLRKQLAELATEMKKLRNICNDYRLQDIENFAETVLKSPTSKTLAPYLENSDYKNLMKTKVINVNNIQKLNSRKVITQQ